MCAKTYCPHGRMCVLHQGADGGAPWTTCDCPESCAPEDAPVCTYFNLEFSNMCEMHKFACENQLILRVKKQGGCDGERGFLS